MKPTVTLAAAALAAALATMAPRAQASIEPHTISMTSTSSSCISNCTLPASHTTDNDAATSSFGSYTDLAVATAVDGSAPNSFAVSAAGTTTITGPNSFSVHLMASRPGLGNQSTGSYTSQASTGFSFRTDASGGTMHIAYLVSYQRPIGGIYLNTGVGFSAPLLEMLFGGRSVPALDYDSTSGTVSGSWDYVLQPNTLYSLTLDANNTTAYTEPSGIFGADVLDAQYQVTLPAFGAPVPEPATWALWMLGVAGFIARRRLVND